LTIKLKNIRSFPDALPAGAPVRYERTLHLASTKILNIWL